MIERDRPGFNVSCDNCSEQVFIDEERWADMMEEFRQLGWVTIRGKGSEWDHHCPSCVDDEKQADGGGIPDGETW